MSDYKEQAEVESSHYHYLFCSTTTNSEEHKQALIKLTKRLSTLLAAEAERDELTDELQDWRLNFYIAGYINTVQKAVARYNDEISELHDLRAENERLAKFQPELGKLKDENERLKAELNTAAENFVKMCVLIEQAKCNCYTLSGGMDAEGSGQTHVECDRCKALHEAECMKNHAQLITQTGMYAPTNTTGNH
jgi:uncharacterized phage infection (PIP) family protein YhgE